MPGPQLALALWLLGAATQSAANAAPLQALQALQALQVQQVAAGVFVHFGRPLDLEAPGHDDIANIGFIVGSRCVAVIDTGGSVRVGRALLAAIRQRTQKPICYVINTHVHVDHVLGNAAFKDSHASFIGHAALPAAIARSRPYFLQHYPEDLDPPASAEQIIAPDRGVQDRLELDLGDRRLQLRAWPVAHTDCDLSVLDESTRTLFTGDLLFRQRLPAVDGDVGGWLKVIDELAHMPVKRAIPGHGPLTTDLESALVPERRYLRALLEGVRSAIDLGQSLPEAIDGVAASEKSQWLLWDSTHPRNVTRVYDQLEWQ
jgi:quinoprotein relay system zinc metallohydrolase 2